MSRGRYFIRRGSRLKTKKLDKASVCNHCKKLMPVGTYVEYKHEGRSVWHKYQSDCIESEHASVLQSAVDNDVMLIHGRFFNGLQNQSLTGTHTATVVIDFYDKLINRLKWSAGKKPSTTIWLIKLGCLFGVRFDTERDYIVSDEDGRHTTFVEKSLSDPDVLKVAVVVDTVGGFPKRIVLGTVGHDGSKKAVRTYNL